MIDELVLPEGLQSVRPNVKPGWTVTLKKEPESMKGEVLNTGEEAPMKITEIIWSGGSIPAEQRDEFVFSAQAPASETSLNWKAYQTYVGGKIVAWDNDSKTVEEYTKDHPAMEGMNDENAPKPFSVTKVVNDLKPTGEPKKESGQNNALPLSILAIVLAAGSLGYQIYSKK